MHQVVQLRLMLAMIVSCVLAAAMLDFAVFHERENLTGGCLGASPEPLGNTAPPSKTKFLGMCIAMQSAMKQDEQQNIRGGIWLLDQRASGEP